ncbi:MAG TPA: glycosyltransferase [Polyangia bacterium]|jgi:glycosyltransferase involved in cell wall biosynthesis
MTEAAISVVIPVFNGAPFIRRAIESVRAQTLPAAELLVVDDGSTDGTAAVLDAIDGVTRLGDGRNRGQSAALNLGVAESRHRLVAFLDADDVWMPDKLAHQVAVLAEAPDLEAVFGHVRERVDVRQSRLRFRDGRVLAARLPSALLIRREAWARIGPFDETLRIGAPVDWYARASAAGLRERLLPDVVYERHIHGANLGFSADAAEAYFAVVRRQVRRLRGGGP